jgi:NTP pyrophosphatase (non-canonical NTP hydrolase)
VEHFEPSSLPRISRPAERHRRFGEHVCGRTPAGGSSMNDELRAHLKLHLEWSGLQGEERLRFLALALAGECGELCNLMKKRWRDGNDRRDLLVDELADVGNYCHMLAMALGVNLEEQMLRKLLEVENRPAWLLRK